MNEYAPIPEAPARPVRTHRFLDRHTIAGFLLLTLWGYLVAQLVGVVAALPFSISAALGGGLDEELLNTVVGFACAVGGFLALLIHKRWFRPEFRGCLRGAYLGEGLLMLAVPFVLIFGITLLGPLSTEGLTLRNISLALMAGVTEEVAFRGIPGSYLMRQWRAEKAIPRAAILTSIVFGLIHATNIFVGADPVATLVQVIYAFCLGILFAAVYLRTTNLLPTMLLHFLNDVLAFLATGYVVNGVQVQAFSLADNLFNLGLGLVFALLGFWLIRPAKRAAILARWDERWSREAEAAPQEDAALA